MGLFDSETKEQKMYKAIEGFEIHTSDKSITREITESKFIMDVGLNTYELISNMANKCKRNGYNGMIGLQMSQSGGLAGAAGVVVYATAVKFK